MEPFAQTIDAAKKYVVSSTLNRVDWTAEPLPGDQLETAVQQLKQQPGKGLFVGGVRLRAGIDGAWADRRIRVRGAARLAGHGPTLFAGLSKPLELKLVDRLEFASGAVAMRYEPRSRAT